MDRRGELEQIWSDMLMDGLCPAENLLGTKLGAISVMSPESMIERMARAWYEACLIDFDAEGAFDRLPDSAKEGMYRRTRAVLMAMRDPTDAMDQAALIPWREGVGPSDLFRTMIDAALEEKA